MPEIPRYPRGRISPPPVARAARLPLQQPGYGGQALAQGFAYLGDLANKRDEANAVSWVSSKTAEAVRWASVNLPEAKRQAAEGAPGFAGAFDATVGKYFDGILKTAPSKQAAELAAERFAKLRTTLFTDAVSFEAAAGRAKRLVDNKQSLSDLATAAYNDPGGAGGYLAQAHGDLAAAAKTWMLPADVSAARAIQAPTIATAAVRGLIATEPAAAVAALNAGHFDSGLNGAAKAALVSQAEAAVRAMAAEKKAAVAATRRTEKAALLKAQKVTQNDFLARLDAPPGSDTPPLTVGDVLASNLDPFGGGSKQTFSDLVTKRLQGGELNFTDPRLYRTYQEKITAGDITDPKALIGAIGKGLSITDFQRLEGNIEQSRSAKGRADLVLKKRAVDAARTSLTTTNYLKNILDTPGDLRFLAFQTELDQRLKKGLAEGKSYLSMLSPPTAFSPASPDYIVGDLLKTYHRTVTEILSDQVRAVKAKPAEAKPAKAKPAAGGIPQRLAGETYTAWRKRTGIM